MRNHVVIVDVGDSGSSPVSFHGIVLAPEGMSVTQAKQVISACYDQVRVVSEEWNFGQVLDRVAGIPGFSVLRHTATDHGIWVE